VASRWQHVGDLIGSGFKPHTYHTRSERLTTYAFFDLILKPTLEMPEQAQ